MNDFYYLPPHILDQIFYLSSNYKENYDKVINTIKYNQILKEFRFNLQEPLDDKLTSFFILTRLKLTEHFKLGDDYDPIYCWNIFQRLTMKQSEYDIFYELKFKDLISHLNLVL